MLRFLLAFSYTALVLIYVFTLTKKTVLNKPENAYAFTYSAINIALKHSIDNAVNTF